MLPQAKDILGDDLEASVQAFYFDVSIQHTNNGIIETKMLLVGDGFPEVFDLPFLHKSNISPLSSPMQVIVSSTLAVKLFGTTDVVGKSISACCFAGMQRDLTISAVYAPLMHATHLDLELIVRRDDMDFTNDEELLHSWLNVNLMTYFKLVSNNPEKSQNILNNWLLNEGNPLCEALNKTLRPPDNTCKKLVEFSLVPISTILLNSQEPNGFFNGTEIKASSNEFVLLLTAATCIIILAGMNSVSLLFAQMPKLSKEFLLRKLLGSSLKKDLSQLYFHFLSQILLAGVLSTTLLSLLCLFFPEITEKFSYFATSLPIFSAVTIILLILLLPFLMAIYPAIFFRNLTLPTALKNRAKSVRLSHAKLLFISLIIQYTVCFTLAFSAMSIFFQLRHFEELNMKTENVFLLDVSSIGKNADTLLTALNNVPGIEDITSVSIAPGMVDVHDSKDYQLLETPSIIADNRTLIVNYVKVSENFHLFSELGSIQEQAVNQALKNLTNNRTGAFINYSAMHLFGFRTVQEAIGKTLQSNLPSGKKLYLEIVNVLPDDHYQSAYHPVKPTVFEVHPTLQKYLLVKVNPASNGQIERQIQEAYTNTSQSRQLPQSLKQIISSSYLSQYRLATLMIAICLTSLVITCFTQVTFSKNESVIADTEERVVRVFGANERFLERKRIYRILFPLVLALVLSMITSIIVIEIWRHQFVKHLDIYGMLASFVIACIVIFAAIFLSVSKHLWASLFNSA